MFKYVRFEEVQAEFTKLGFVQKNEDVKVIYFDKAIAALIAESEVLIDELISSQNPLINCEIISYDDFKAIVETTAQYERVLMIVKEQLDKDMCDIEKKYPSKERETWPLQKEEAMRFQSSKDEIDAPFLKVLADDENDTVENFANAVLAKNEAYTSFSSHVIAKKRAHQARLLKELGF